MELVTFARIVHVLAIIWWIGGVAMVTLVLLPALRKMADGEAAWELFEKLEGRFAFQARIATLLAAASGFWMLYLLDSWSRYAQLGHWWLHAMTALWFIFSLILFVLEPFFLHQKLKKAAKTNAKKVFRLVYRAHWVLLILSVITLIGAVAGSHGWFFIA